MTGVCLGGTSSPKIGTEAVVAYSQGRLAQLLVAAGMSELNPFLPLLYLLPVVTSTFCATDPPTSTDLTPAEANALLKVELGADFLSGLDKVKNWILGALWYDICKCDSTTAVPLTPAVYPSTAIHLKQPAPEPVAACATFLETTHTNFTGTMVLQRGGFGTNGLAPTKFKLHSQNNIVAGGGATLVFKLHQYNNVGTEVGTPTPITVTAGVSADTLIDPVVGLYSATYECACTAQAGTSDDFNTKLELFCNGSQPGDTKAPCCPPDTASYAQMQSILDLVKSMQRFYAPFAFVGGLTFASRTGTGSIPVTRSIGVSVSVDSAPPGRVSAGNPNYIYDQGWLSVSNGGSMLQERRFSQHFFIWLPDKAALADSINYYLPPGIVASLTPLYPEAPV